MGAGLVTPALEQAGALHGHHEECAMHVRATKNTGASREDICEAMLHVAIYAGVPAANSAIKIIKKIFEEEDTAES